MNSESKIPGTRHSTNQFGGDSCPADSEEVYLFGGTAITDDDNDDVYEFKAVNEDAAERGVILQRDESNPGIRNPWVVPRPVSPASSLRSPKQFGNRIQDNGDSPATSAFRKPIILLSALWVVCLAVFAINQQATDPATNVIDDRVNQTIERDSSDATQNLQLSIAQKALTENRPNLATPPDESSQEYRSKNMNMTVVQLYRTGNESYGAGRYRDAISSYEAALELEPNNATACNNLARLLATCPDDACRNALRARKLSEIACSESANQDWKFLSVRAVAEAECGDFVKAIEYTKFAISHAPLERHMELKRMVEQFRNRQPCRWP